MKRSSSSLASVSLGSDTGGSVRQPAYCCGVTGLRPTFGRVSRHGAMVLAWTQDTVGPMCRSAEDCALVLDAIQGPDGLDNSLIDVPFNWDAAADVTRLRVGYLRAAFEGPLDSAPDDPDGRALAEATRANNQAALAVYQAVRKKGTQKDVVATMQTRDELYDYLDYHSYEQKLDELFRRERA